MNFDSWYLFLSQNDGQDKGKEYKKNMIHKALKGLHETKGEQ